MGRLIDADALIDLFTKDKELLQRGLSKDSKFAYMTADYVIKTISEQPTAYNVDKVVAELEELQTKAITRYKGGTFGDYEGTDYFIDKHKTIEIVRKGGV